MAMQPVKYFSVVGVVRKRFSSACASADGGRRLLAEDVSDVLFKSVTNDELHLVLSDAHADIFKIKTVSLTKPAAGADPQPVSCSSSDAACIRMVTGDTGLVRVVAPPTPVAVLDAIVGARTVPATPTTVAVKADEESTDGDKVLIIVVVVVTVVLLLCVVGVVMCLCSRQSPASGVSYAPVGAPPGSLNAAPPMDPMYGAHPQQCAPQYPAYAPPMPAMHPSQYQYMCPH